MSEIEFSVKYYHSFGEDFEETLISGNATDERAPHKQPVWGRSLGKTSSRFTTPSVASGSVSRARPCVV